MTHASIYAQAAFQQWIEQPFRVSDAYGAWYWGGSTTDTYGATFACLGLWSMFERWIGYYPGPASRGALVIWKAIRMPRWSRDPSTSLHMRDQTLLSVIAAVFCRLFGDELVVAKLYQFLDCVPMSDLRDMQQRDKEGYLSSLASMALDNFILDWDEAARSRARLEISLFDRKDLPDELRQLIGSFASGHVDARPLRSVDEMKQHARCLMSAHTFTESP